MSWLRSVVDELAGEDLAGVHDRQLEDDLVELNQQITRLSAQRSRRLAEIDRRGTYESLGYLSTTSWIRDRCRISAREATTRVHRARSLSHMPATSAAYEAGDLDTPVVDLLTQSATSATVERTTRISVSDAIGFGNPFRQPGPRHPSEVERDQVAAVRDELDRLRFPGLRVAPHAGGVGRHARQCQPDRVGSIVEQLEDGAGRHVPFDHVTIDEGGVARGSARRNAVVRLECGQILILSEIDAGSKLLQVPDPP